MASQPENPDSSDLPNEHGDAEAENTAEQVDATEASEACEVEQSIDDASEDETSEPNEDTVEESIDWQARCEAEAARAEEQAALALRLHADMENLRKRSARDVDSARKFALEKFANELLPVRDSLEMGLDAASKEDANLDSIREGTDLTLKMLTGAMDKFHLVAVDPVGESFDPERHQAMTMQESAEHAPNTVIAVMQKGYTLNDRLLRPALVMVSKAAASDA